MNVKIVKYGPGALFLGNTAPFENFSAELIVLCKLRFFISGSGRIIALSSGSGHIIKY
jgi:hypothetical protein